MKSRLFSPIERFWKFTRKLPGENNCWVWIGTRNNGKKGGHARFYFEGRVGLAHRFAYEHWVGKIPDGYELHHVCEHSWCVNPGHLKAISNADHLTLTHYGVKRPMTLRRMYCPRGHRLAGDNLIRNGGGHLWCRECRRMHQWCLRHGLKMTDFTPQELQELVPNTPREKGVASTLQ
jgi:HNH endonuclease